MAYWLLVACQRNNKTLLLLEWFSVAIKQQHSLQNPFLTTLLIYLCQLMHAGKSSLLNAMCGEERVIVCDLSGTTRDAVDTEVTLPDGKRLKLIDTAGIRRRTKASDGGHACCFTSLSVVRGI